MNKQITYIFLYFCFLFVNILFFYNSEASDDFMNCDGCGGILPVSQSFAELPPNMINNLVRSFFDDEAYCKLTPNIKVLLSIPQDRDFEKKYITEYEEVLRRQCDE